MADTYTGAASRVLSPLGWEAVVDAEVSRSTGAGIAVLSSRLPVLGQTVVVHLANNYDGDPRRWGQQVEEVQRMLRAVPCVVWLTVAEFQPNRREVNDVIRSAAARHPSMVVGDWAARVASDRGLVAGDGLHLTSRGAETMAALVAGLVGSPGQARCGTVSEAP
jgi:hypothetical protein